jgi:Na+/melibiose symporter-like transporter
MWLFAMVCMVTGATLGADIALPAALQARLANFDSSNTGHPREAASFGLWGMAGKLALACAVGLTFPLLELLPAGESRDSALPWLYALAPVLVKLLTLIGVELARASLSISTHGNLVEENIDEHKALVPGSTDVLGAERV